MASTASSEMEIGSSSRSQCGLSGCPKPIHGSLSASGAQHLACGEFHHLLLMAARFDPSSPPPHLALLDRNYHGLCASPSCPNPPFPSGHFCSRSHHISWLSQFCSSLSPRQMCRFRGCHRHVFVESPSPDSPRPRAHEFCGWRHCQNFTIVQAFESRGKDEQSPPSPSSSPPSSGPSSPKIKTQSSDMNSHILTLRKFASEGVEPENLQVVDHFFSKHPWEILKGNVLYLIAACKYMSHTHNVNHKNQKRKMTTKESYHWKQQGPGTKGGGISTKHFTYIKLKSKRKISSSLHGETSYAPIVEDGLYGMKEYTIEDVTSHCLVKLFKRSGKQTRYLERGDSPHSTVTEAVLPMGFNKEKEIHEESCSSIFSGLQTICELECDNTLSLKELLA